MRWSYSGEAGLFGIQDRRCDGEFCAITFLIFGSRRHAPVRRDLVLIHALGRPPCEGQIVPEQQAYDLPKGSNLLECTLLLLLIYDLAVARIRSQSGFFTIRCRSGGRIDEDVE